MRQQSSGHPWVVFSLRRTLCAVAARDVLSMVTMPSVSRVPHVPDFVRGVVNFRGKVMPVVDLRARLGMKSFLTDVEEFCAMMDQREQDHKNWLRELEASVRERREFTLAVDPHQCAFGKWYDSYTPESHLLEMLLKKFAVPHARIHGIAAKIKEMEAQGRIDDAFAMIEQCRDNELAEMIRLFAEVRKAYMEHSREICMVLTIDGGRSMAVAVDTIEAVERIDDTTVQDVPAVLRQEGIDDDCVAAIGKRCRRDDIVLLMDHDKIAAGVVDGGAAATM